MSTMRQKKLARAIVDSLERPEPITKAELLESVGYSRAVANKAPKRQIELQGVKDELKILGFDEESAKQVVAKIMLNDEAKDRDRLTAADMNFKVHGTYAPEKKVNLNIEVNAERFERLKELSNELKQRVRQRNIDGDGGS